MFRITATGSPLLGASPPTAAGSPSRRIRVQPDSLILAPHGTACFDRFRLAYFSEWQASRPEFRYRITRKSLGRAADQGITPQRIVAFLKRACGTSLPDGVVRSLTQSED